MQFKEHRGSERFNYEAPVIIENCETGQFYDGSMYNYSRGGIYVELDDFLNPGTHVRIVVEKMKNISQEEFCQAKIIWCREITGAVVLYNYGAGIQYDSTFKPVDCRTIFKVIEGGASEKKI